MTGWITTREPEYDDTDRAMFDAYHDIKADVHTCGRPLSESLKDPDVPDPDYQVSVEVCRACMAYDKFRAEHAKSDDDLRTQGRHPETYRIHTVLPLADLPPEARDAILANRMR